MYLYLYLEELSDFMEWSWRGRRVKQYWMPIDHAYIPSEVNPSDYPKELTTLADNIMARQRKRNLKQAVSKALEGVYESRRVD